MLEFIKALQFLVLPFKKLHALYYTIQFHAGSQKNILIERLHKNKNY